MLFHHGVVWLHGFSDSSTSQRCPILSLDTGAPALAVTCFHSHAVCHCEVTSMTAYAVARALSESHGEAERDWGPLGSLTLYSTILPQASTVLDPGLPKQTPQYPWVEEGVYVAPF